MNSDNFWHLIRQYFAETLVSIIVGLVAGILMARHSTDPIVDGLVVGTLGTLATAFVAVYVKSTTLFRDLAESITRLELHHNLHDLQELAQSLPPEKYAYYASKFAEVSKVGGGIIIHSRPKEYLSHLEDVLKCTHSSVMTTLRGGEKPLYPLDWFLRDDGDLPSEERLAWLSKVKEAKIRTKIRLLMFDEDDADDRGALGPLFDGEKRWKLLRAMLDDRSESGSTRKYATRVFLVDPKKIFDALVPSRGSDESRIVYDDFALFDDQLVLKHNGASSLTIAIQEQIELYHKLFELFKQFQGQFKELTFDKIGGESWEEWAARWKNKETKEVGSAMVVDVRLPTKEGAAPSNVVAAGENPEPPSPAASPPMRSRDEAAK